MSNIVKYPFVNMQGKEVRTVSYEEPDEFKPLKQTSKVVVRSAEEVEEEKKRGLDVREIFRLPDEDRGEDDSPKNEEGFEAGLSVKKLDEEANRLREEAEGEANEIIQAAREQADQIVVEARQQADQVRAQAHEEGIELGRDEGIAQGIDETNRIREELESERSRLEDEYNKQVADLEPKFVGILCGLIQKITGVIVEENQDLILHLIRCGLKDVHKAERIIVRVSPEDAVIAESYKKDLMEELGEEVVSFEIQGQDTLEKNECIIEADNQMLDAGINTQLDNLMTALRLLV